MSRKRDVAVVAGAARTRGLESKDLAWPEMASAWTGIFEEVIYKYSAKPSHSEFKARKRVRDAVDEELSRRKLARR